MGDSTSISWTDATWNPIRGCRRTAPAGSKQSGCGDPTGGGCYAERQAARFCGPGGAYEGLITLTKNGPRWSGKTKFVAEHLADPLRWKTPRRIFVDSMSDLFYEGFSNEQIAAVFGVMAAAPRHTFQVLTKRARRMREWFEWLYNNCSTEDGYVPRDVLHYFARKYIHEANDEIRIGHPAWPIWNGSSRSGRWPLPNVWLGVSVENQAAADERIPDLLKTPAAVRFLSCEPLLDRVSLRQLDAEKAGHDDLWFVDALTGKHDDMGRPCRQLPHIDWVIAGCESGPKSRECQVEWLRSLRDQCASAGVSFFLKQAVESLEPDSHGFEVNPDGVIDEPIRFDEGSKAKGRGHGGAVIELPYLDGVQHAAFPEVRHA